MASEESDRQLLKRVLSMLETHANRFERIEDQVTRLQGNAAKRTKVSVKTEDKPNQGNLTVLAAAASSSVAAEEKRLEEEHRLQQQEQQRLQQEKEQQLLQQEKEQQRLQQEKEQQRLQQEKEQQLLQQQEKDRLQQEKEQQRLQQEKEQQLLQQEKEQQLLQQEKEQQLLQQQEKEQQLLQQQEKDRLQQEKEQQLLQQQKKQERLDKEAKAVSQRSLRSEFSKAKNHFGFIQFEVMVEYLKRDANKPKIRQTAQDLLTKQFELFDNIESQRDTHEQLHGVFSHAFNNLYVAAVQKFTALQFQNEDSRILLRGYCKNTLKVDDKAKMKHIIEDVVALFARDHRIKKEDVEKIEQEFVKAMLEFNNKLEAKAAAEAKAKAAAKAADEAAAAAAVAEAAADEAAAAAAVAEAEIVASRSD
jgi:hypothetical protein